MKIHKTFRIAAFVAAGAVAVPLSAQQADTSKRLEKVTVTATRSPISILKVPLAVSIIGAEQLRASRGYGFDDVLNNVPGVFAQSRSGNQDVRITIRGFGARGAGDRSNAGTSRGIRVLLDGIPETEPDGRTSFDAIDMANAERIDVIRSNASATWGNAAGGVINVSSVPVGEGNTFRLQEMLGSFGLLRNNAHVGRSFDSGNVYGSLANSSFDGYRVGSASRRTVLNVGGVSRIGDATTLSVTAVGTNNLFNIPGPLTRAQAEADPTQANATYQARRERRFNRTARFGVALDHRPENGLQYSSMLYANPKYLQRSERGTFRDFTRYHVGGNFTAGTSMTLTEGVTSRVLVGADEAYQDGAILFYGLTAAGERASDLRDNKREGANNLGLFVQDELVFNNRTRLTLGLRYDNIKYHSQSYINPKINGSKAFERVTPKVGLSISLSPARTLYASMGGGVEAPAGNETDPAGTFGQDTVFAINPLLNPIRSTTFEVGTKHIIGLSGEGFLREFSYDLAVYSTQVLNEIVPYRGGRFYFTAGEARRQGAELGLSMGTSIGLSLQTALTLSHNEYVDYKVDSVHYNLAKAGVFADYSGNEVVGTPSLMANVSMTLSPAAWNGVALRAGVHGVGKYFADDANELTVPGYGLVNLALSIDRPVRLTDAIGYTGFIGINNLFGRNYMESAFLNPDLIGGVPVAFEPGLPRNTVISLSLVRMK